MSALHPVTVPARVGEPPMLELHLSVDETVAVIRRHLNRVASSGQLAVEFRATRHAGGRGLTTTIHCTETPPHSEPE